MTKSHLSILAIYVRPISTIFGLVLACITPSLAHAAVNIPLTVNLSETVNVTGTPRIAVDVGGTTRYATYTSGTGTNALTFTLAPQAGDVDLDGVTVSSPIDLNGGTITDVKGNNAALTFTPPGTTNVKVNYPSLGMDFVYDADGRYTLNGTVYNDLTSFLSATGGTFTRASIGTYFDSTGTLQTAASGTPRFDYDPVTHAAKGILIEESRTNLLKDSSNPTTANWIRANVSATAGTNLAPDNTMSGSTITVTVAASPAIVQKPPLAAGYVFSAYIKAGTATSADVGLYNYTTTSWGTVASESTGLILQGPGMIVQNNYARWRITGLSSTQWTRFSVYRSTQADGALIYPGTVAGSVGSSLIMWGAQVESGTFATSYIPTTTATVTRAADVFSIPTGSWTDSAKGTLYNEGYQSYLVTSHPTYLSSLGTGTSSDFIATYLTTGAAKSGALNVGGTDYYNLGSGTYIAGNLLKSAITYKANDFRMSADGSLAAPVASGPIPSTILLRIGDRDGTRTWNGTLKQIKYYPTRVTNTQLQLLTQ